jgi:hypothetical protein
MLWNGETINYDHKHIIYIKYVDYAFASFVKNTQA